MRQGSRATAALASALSRDIPGVRALRARAAPPAPAPTSPSGYIPGSRALP